MAEARIERRLTSEERALLLAVQAEPGPAQLAELGRLLGMPGFDWERFWKLATQQQVLPLVAPLLSGSELGAVAPERVRREARTGRLQTLFYNTTAHRELRRIAERFRAAGIPTVPLKGTHLAERLYDSLDGRQVGDIDILVRESDLESARALLLGDLGYALSAAARPGVLEHAFHGVPYVRKGPAQWFAVELHWGLGHPHFLRFDYEALWRRTLAASPAESPLRPLPAEETLVFLATHQPKHDLGALRLLADVDRLVRRERNLDWERTLRIATRWGARWLLHCCLARTVALYATPLPAGFLDACRPPGWRRALVALLADEVSLLRPSDRVGFRYNRTQLAFCALLESPVRIARAYYLNLVGPYVHRSGPGPAAAPALLRAAAQGLVWTVLTLASSLLETARPGRQTG